MEPYIHKKVKPRRTIAGSGQFWEQKGEPRSQSFTAPISVLGLLLPFINLTYWYKVNDSLFSGKYTGFCI